MSRIPATFDALKRAGEKALVAFVTAGDPNPALSKKIILALCRASIDVLELGVPFSDPTADGPVIQRSSQRAIRAGVGLSTVLEMAGDIRKKTAIPIVLFSYYNPILAYGPGRFYTDALAAGADGVLVVDLPPEESREMTDEWSGSDLDLIRLVAPTTPVDRMRKIARMASGFLYLVSMTGVTGSGGLDSDAVSGTIRMLKGVTRLPVCVGFGISTPSHVAGIARLADGVVVGSAFERRIEANLQNRGLPALMGKYAESLKRATRGF
jgi:tryptophan synthase alpha chain